MSVGAAGFSTDESKVLVDNNASGIYNVYEVNVADTVSKPLTSSKKESFFAIDYLPNNDSFLYSADNGGDENAHIYLRGRKDSTSKDLTPWPKSTNSFSGWSVDKKAMYVSSNKRDQKYFDIWKLETASWKPTLLYENKEGLTPTAVSKSERYVALTKETTTDKNDLYLYDRTTKTTKRLSNDNEATWNALAFEKNDSIMYYASNDGSEFSYINKYSIATGKSEKFFEDKWDVVNMNLSENEKYHTIFINEDGKNKVLLFDHATGKAVNFPEIKDADVLNVIISNSEKNLLLTVGSSTSPTNLYSYNIEKQDLKQLTSTLNKAIDQNDLVKSRSGQVQIIRWKGNSCHLLQTVTGRQG